MRNIFKQSKTSGLKINGQRATLGKPAETGGAKKEASGWVSPDYDTSRAMYLNPVVAAANRCVAALPSSSDTEAYKLIRTHLLQKGAEGEGKTVMITSALPGEGKTLTAINLAFTVARDFSQTVLLVDCDLRKQHIHRMLGINSEKGLADCLLGTTPVPDVIIWPGIEKLTLISGGKAVDESAELLGSPRMKELVQEMRTRYPERYVFFDVPPILTSADALAFAPYVDYIIVVVASGVTPLPDVNSALEFLPKEKILGLVLNNNGGE